MISTFSNYLGIGSANVSVNTYLSNSTIGA
jgi:hypothetical protein